MITKPSLAVPPWADSGDIIQPETSYIASGFPRTNDKPTRQAMNFALNYAWNGVQYLVSRGIPEWDATQSYAAGDVVRASGKFYSATSAANNVNRNPPSSSTFWTLWYVFAADLNTLYITAAQVASVYLPRTEAASLYVTPTTLNQTRDNLQNQINSIVTVTGRGYSPGSGIAINSENVISNTAPNVNADWNAAVGTGGNILNKPTFATVATSGSYNDLTNRPALATVALTGNYNSLTNLPPIPPAQVNADWNAVSGVTQILNKPAIAWDGTNITTSAPVTINNTTVIRDVWVPATDSGQGYFQIRNNGQFGAVHPWLYSSTGQIQIRSTSLYVQNGVSANGDVSTSTNMSCTGGFWCGHIWLADLHLTNDGGWLRSSAGFATTSINISGIQLNNRGDGWLEVHSAVEFKSAGSFALWLSVAQNITANGDITSSANVACNAIFCGGLSWSNNGGWMYTPQGVSCAGISTGGDVICGNFLANGNATTGRLTVNGEVRADNNQVFAAGHRCRAGISGGFLGNAFNITWDGSRPHIWIDNTDTGWIQTNPSDYRLKQDVELIEAALPRVLELRPVTFCWRELSDDIWDGHDGELHAGFLAHEVQQVFAGAAEGKKDALTKDGKLQPQRINEIDIIALLTRALQELANKVSRLESKMNDIVPELN